MKRFITVLLVLSMVIGLVPAFAVSAAEKASGITIDGKLDDWAGIDTVSVIGSGEADGKKVTFYGKLTDEGLYLAADAYHATFTTTEGDWWKNTNFEIFVNRSRGNGNQHWLSAKGMGSGAECAKSNDKIVAKMVNEEVTGKGAAKYHTVAEMFLSAADFDFVRVTQEYGTINVGMAWKTPGDKINNGEANGGGMDEYWVPKGSWPANNNKLVVTAEGVYTEAAYYPEHYDFIPRQSKWSYLTATNNPDAAGEGWNTTLNTAWAIGDAPFGNRADGKKNTWGTTDNPSDGTQNNAYLWVAKEFTVESIKDLEGISLFAKMYYDDDIKLYVNGKLVYQHGEWNNGYDRYMLAYDASTVLKEGKNIIAASLHQHSGGYEFDLELYATNLPQDRNNNLPAYSYIQTVEQYMQLTYICNVLSSRSRANTKAKYIYLENDLSFEGKEWTPLNVWKGVLDGQGHKITNITAVTEAANGDYGLIVNELSNDNFNGTVRNLTVADSIIVAGKTDGSVGAVAGFSDRGKVESCKVENVTVIGGKTAGGVVGLAAWQSDGADTVIADCTVKDTTVVAKGITTEAGTVSYAASLLGMLTKDNGDETHLRVGKVTLDNVVVKAVTTADIANVRDAEKNTIQPSAEGSVTDVTKTDDLAVAVTEGAASVFNAAAPANVVIKTTASAMAVKKVNVGGKSVDFTVTAGDAVSEIVVAPAALAGFVNGEYDVAIETYEGDLSAKLTVEGVPSIPENWEQSLGGTLYIVAFDGETVLVSAEYDNTTGTLTVDGQTYKLRGTLADNNIVIIDADNNVAGTVTKNGNDVMISLGKLQGYLKEHVEGPEPDNGLVVGENAVKVPGRGDCAAVTFKAPVDGKYILKAAAGETNAYVALTNEFGIEVIELPYKMNLKKGQIVSFEIGSSDLTADADEINLVIETDAEIPETGDIAMFIALAGILSLGVAVVALKRRQSVR